MTATTLLRTKMQRKISKARLTAKQMDTLDREMRDRNLLILKSITDVKSPKLGSEHHYEQQQFEQSQFS